MNMIPNASSQCTARKLAGRSRSSSPCKSLSEFETIITTHQPVLESLLLQLPTLAILTLYHTSQYLKSFLRACPLAWNALSFRNVSTTQITERQQSPASDSSADASGNRSKPYALDQLLLAVVLPFGICLRSLELDRTAVSGHTLTSSILPARRGTLQHLSVRECKNVSLKYHIIPYLNLFKLQISTEAAPAPIRTDCLALKSLYTYRCAHHRRRPYTTGSLRRPESDAKATHDFILLCHSLDIWIDSGWCPTPGGRCPRRKQYFLGRGTNDLQIEVWVVFDRLWRSRNQIGLLKPEESLASRLRGQVWKDEDYGYHGEALGIGSGLCATTPGKLIPTHLRQSHAIFVENHKCHACGGRIPERCEQCSIKMHCMGCRKTLCASCTYAKALPCPKSYLGRIDSEEPSIRDRELFWWAPNAWRSPNLMDQEKSDEGSNAADALAVPSIRTSWCCIKPQFSPGGRITLIGLNATPEQSEYIYTAPLPPGRGFEDPDFHPPPNQGSDADSKSFDIVANAWPKEYDPMLYWLLFGFRRGPLSACPRNLCNECSQTTGWKVKCRACQEPICLAHELRSLQARVCGYKDLSLEDSFVKERMLQVVQEALIHKRAQVEVMKQITAHLQKHGTLDAQQEFDLAVLTELPASNDDDLGEHQDTVAGNLGSPSITAGAIATTAFEALPFKPPPYNNSDGPLNTVNLWRGCASFMCQEFRSSGDHRRRCLANTKKCIECRVNVCFECWTKQMPCACSYCSDNYHCPNCLPETGLAQCKKAEELESDNQDDETEERGSTAMS